MEFENNTVVAIVGSKNPVKISAFKDTLARVFPQQQIDCRGVDAPSLVSEQPMSEKETYQGAVNRVKFCQSHFNADFYAAMEGGVDNFEYGPATFAYVVVSAQSKLQVGRSANLPIPESVFSHLQQGEELGPLMDKLFGTSNIKQKGGAIGLLTNGLETRGGNYTQALTLAMAPFLHADRF
ncbi:MULTISPECIES: inosine/xanthosine triphosphatase [Alteromonadaceae]|uniref:inosine/xanthosine triphosphatase n=1 Tax=Alteromonadaceae TaxID=72275 RepID=UPI001C0A4354|nr:inosine/xanthosine triphosphatase [Aliiglaciecola lipolytica]MBU2876770.1 inosine/xanthosine triphosphatase [Aliiglaciecola lipolytica]